MHSGHVFSAREDIDDVSTIAGTQAQRLDRASPLVEVFRQPRLDLA